MAARWELLGNAVTVPVARWIGERLAQPYKYKYFHRGNLNDWAENAPDAWPGSAWNMARNSHHVIPTILPPQSPPPAPLGL